MSFSFDRSFAVCSGGSSVGCTAEPNVEADFFCCVCSLCVFRCCALSDFVHASAQCRKRVSLELLSCLFVTFFAFSRFACLSFLASQSGLLSSDCASLFFGGVCVLNLLPSERANEAVKLFRAALQAAVNANRTEYLAMISGPSALSIATSSYLLNVISLLETNQRHDSLLISQLVVEMSGFALSVVPEADAHVFVSKSFRHNLRSRRFADA